MDRDIRKVALHNLWKGFNQIILRCCYRNAMELEECYLCGEFGVTKSRRIVAMPRVLCIGDWTTQGFFHYAGSICYQYQFDWSMGRIKHIYLKLRDYAAVGLCVSVNGKSIEVPWKTVSILNITDYLKNGENQLSVEVIGSPRNLFGPFHLRDVKRGVTNDRCFQVEGAEYVEEYNELPYGIYENQK